MDIPPAKNIILSLIQDPELLDILVDIAAESGDFELLIHVLEALEYIPCDDYVV